MPQLVDLAGLTTRGLLRLYADILTELVRRGVVRSRNAPAGDLGEHLVLLGYGGELGARSGKLRDVRAADGQILQIKSRSSPPATAAPTSTAPSAPSTSTRACSSSSTRTRTTWRKRPRSRPARSRPPPAPVPHVNGWRIGTRARLLVSPGAVDVTDRLAQAFNDLA